MDKLKRFDEMFSKVEGDKIIGKDGKEHTLKEVREVFKELLNGPLVSRYEVRVAKRTRGRKKSKLCNFYDDYTDIAVIDMKDQKILGWNIQEAKDKMGLLEDDYKVVPYLINELLIKIQETEFEK